MTHSDPDTAPTSEEAVPAYETSPYARRLETAVRESGLRDERPYAILEDTICYPEGGGQPADHGTLETDEGVERVLHVERRDGAIVHWLSGQIPIGPVSVTLDWERRYDHMQQHTAQHVLSALAEDRYGWPTTSFHLAARLCDIELDTGEPSAEQLAALEEEVAREVRAARPITSRRVTTQQLASLGDGVRSRGLPPDHRGSVRLVEIAGLDRNTCGGTHLRSTAEIEAVKLLATERMRGGTRLTWVAGARTRRRLGEHERRNAALRARLETGDDELVAVAQAKLERLAECQYRERDLRRRLAIAEARRLVLRCTSDHESLIQAHFDGLDAGFLRLVLQALGDSAGDDDDRQPPGARSDEPKVVLLTASDDDQAWFALRASAPLDAAALGARVGELLAGRGGGRGELYQGRAGSLERRDQAVAWLRDQVSC